MKIGLVNTLKHTLPSYSTYSTSGMDLGTLIAEDIVLKPPGRDRIKTGLSLEIPVCYKARIRQRSGLAINKGVTVLNSPGEIDSGHWGEDCIILVNLSEDNYVIRDGKRICRMVMAKHEQAEWVTVERLFDTSGKTGGLGHTGKK